MSLIKAIRAQLGLSVTPANNFVLDASADNGTMKLARGNAGATTQDILTVDASGKVAAPQGISSVENLPAFQCRAWVNFNGTRNVSDTGASTVGQPVLIKASGNVVSVVKTAVGKYQININAAMPDANYAVLRTVGLPNASGAFTHEGNCYVISNSACFVSSYDATAFIDVEFMSVAVFR